MNLSPSEEAEIYVQQRFDALMEICARSEKTENLELIRKAFSIAYAAHKGMCRKSGEPYILHPIEVARIVAEEIGLGTTSVVCALLHDTVEDTDVTLEFIKTEFNEKVASIIDGLTKISSAFNVNVSLQAENFRKMLLTLSDDLRVILIKLADRLHNMRTLDALSDEKQIKIAGETVSLFAPLAHRLGLYSIKQELEDLSLKYRHPLIYNEIVAKIKAVEEDQMNFYNEFIIPLQSVLRTQGIQFEFSGRRKSIYSIYYKMQHKEIPFEEIYDLVAVRIVFEPKEGISEKTQCWDLYSAITDIYTPRQDRIRDWITTPKANGYEALHITVMGPNGRWVEIQIRTRRMDEVAERGFAAHWKYKSSGAQNSELDRWLKQVREVLANPSADALEFLDEFRMNLFTSEIQVFTPKGDIHTLPKNAIALDFAYSIHSKVGQLAIAAKVNHKLVPLNYVLKSGDQVEIITSDKKKSQVEWLHQVATAKARSKIKHALSTESKNRIETGQDLLEKRLNELGLLPSSRIFKKLLPEYNVNSKDELYSGIALGIIDLKNLDKVLKKNAINKFMRYWELQFLGVRNKKGSSSEGSKETTGKGAKSPETFLVKEHIDQTSEPSYRLASCCNPIPGDDVMGYLTISGTVVIHKSRCKHAITLASSMGNSVVPVKWATYKIMSFLARIYIQGIDRFGILSTIVTLLTNELKVNIRTLNIASHDGIFECEIGLYVHDVQNLEELIVKLKKLKGIDKVKRIETFQPETEESIPTA